MDKIVTIKDIAEKSGVSIATVSRVFNENGRYSEETKERVLKAAEDLRYVRNIAARQLRTQSTNYIGVLVPNLTYDFYSRVVQSIQLDLLNKGFITFICYTNEDSSIEKKQITMLQEQNVAGIIMISDSLNWHATNFSVPLVCIGGEPLQFSKRSYSLVESDNYQGSNIAVRFLHSNGCKNIAALSLSRGNSIHNSRFQSYLDTMLGLGLVNPNLHLIVEDMSYILVKKKVADILKRNPEIDAFFCTSDWLAIAAMDAVLEAGIRVPDDISIIGFDDIPSAQFRDIPLTTIRQNTSEIAYTSTEILINMINHADNEFIHKTIPVELVERESTRGV